MTGGKSSGAPRLQIRATAGLGKTTAVINELAQRSRFKHVDFYVPRTDLASEIADSLQAQRVSARVFKGRSNGAPKNPMCRKYKLAEQAARLGMNIYRALCKAPSPSGTQVCEFYDECPYIAQWKDNSPRVRLFSHAYLGLPKPRPDGVRLSPPDLVVVDETCVGALVRHMSFPGELLPWDVEFAFQLSLHANTDFRSTLLDIGITKESAIAESERISRMMEKQVTPGLSEEDAFRALAVAAEAGQDKRHRFWLSVAAELDCERPFHGIELCAQERIRLHGGETIRQDRVHLHWKLVPKVAQETPILLLDGTANLEVNQMLFGRQFEEVRIDAKRNVHTIQCHSTRLSQHTLLRSHSGAMENREFSKVLSAIKRHHRDGKAMFVVANQRVQEALQRHIKIPDVTFAHFNDLRGSNQWDQFETVVVVGRLEPSPIDSDRMMRAIWAESSQPLTLVGGQPFPETPMGYRLADGRLLGVLAPHHPDRRGQLLLELIREGESLQAIDRLRLIHGAKPKLAVILCSIPLDVTVNELSSLNELSGSFDGLGLAERAKRAIEVGVVPLNGDDLRHLYEEIRPDILPSPSYAEAMVKELQRGIARSRRGEIGGIDQIDILFETHPQLFLAEYRCQGRRGRRTRVLYDARSVEDPEGMLSLLLYPNVVTEFCRVGPVGAQ